MSGVYLNSDKADAIFKSAKGPYFRLLVWLKGAILSSNPNLIKTDDPNRPVILPEVDLEIAFFYLHSIHALQFVIDRRDQAFDFDPVTIPDCFINVSKAIETVQLIHPPECRRFVNAFLCELSRVASYPEGKFDLQWAIRIFALILTTDKVIFEIYNFPPDKHFSGYKPFEMAQEQIDLWWERTAPEEGEA